MARSLWLDLSLLSFLVLLVTSPSSSSLPSCSVSSTTWLSWKVCATPPTRGVTTPATSPPPSHVMTNLLTFGELNDSSWPGRGWRDTRRDAHSGTEDKSTSANQQACQSISRRLLCSIFQGNLRSEKVGRLQQGQLWRQKLEFREAHRQSLTEMEKSSTFHTIARRKLIEDQNPLLAEFRNCKMKWIVWTILRILLPVNQCYSHPIPEGMLRPSFVSPRRKKGPSCILDAHGTSGNVFADPLASSSTPYSRIASMEFIERRAAPFIHRNSCCLWRKSHLMTSWKACTNKEHESLRNSRPYWNCTTWRFIRRK